MTQEEAREFLMNKKVFVKNKSKEIQLKLFEIGFSWGRHSTNPIYLDKPFIYIWDDGTLCYGHNVNHFYEHNYEEISAEDILNIKIEHLPRTWEEFCKKNPVKKGEAAIACDSEIYTIQHPSPRLGKLDRDILPNSSAAKAHLALMQLRQLRDCYRGNTDSACCYSIIRGVFDLAVVYGENRFLSFPTKKLAEEFLINFKDLIEEAGDLI